MRNETENALAFGLLVGFLVGVTIAIVIGVIAEHCGSTNVRKSAIAAGVGQYVVDKDGKVDFQWVANPESGSLK